MFAAPSAGMKSGGVISATSSIPGEIEEACSSQTIAVVGNIGVLHKLSTVASEDNADTFVITNGTIETTDVACFGGVGGVYDEALGGWIVKGASFFRHEVLLGAHVEGVEDNKQPVLAFIAKSG